MVRGKGSRRPQGKLFKTLNGTSDDPGSDTFTFRPKVNEAIQTYFNNATNATFTDSMPEWTGYPEIPTFEALMYEEEDMPHNNVTQPWESKFDYLRCHYLLLREEALQLLRHNVKIVQDDPSMMENNNMSNLGIYDNVRVCGTTISSRGLGIRIRFGLGRVGKNIHWQQSKRLLSGSLVVLMSADNKDVCKVAVVASRAMSNLEKEDGSLPEIDLFFGRDEDIDVDPLSEWIMVENRSGLFEAQRHTLVALQRMTFEQFPLSEHLVDLQTYIEPPPYLEDNPLRNLECVFPSDGRKSLQKVNVLQSWPEHPPSALDASQLSALERILTKKVATIQGPPGTGKTFVSVQALKVILSNMSSADPPVIVACQTNHALDQLLLHISQFEPLFARLGARSKDRDVILKRTIYELRKASKNPMSKGFKNFREAENNLVRLFRILESDKDLLTVDDFESFDILSPQQCESLRNSEWESSSTDSSPLKEWVGMNLREARAKYHAPLLEYEEVLDEWEVEEVQEHEAETGVAGGSGGADEDEMDVLKGTHIEFGGRLLNNGTKLSDPTIESELKKTRNMWKIQRGKRGAVYCYLQKKLKGAVARAIRDVLPSYHAAVKARRIGNLEADEIILRNQKVIGLTTTGLAKYRALIAALKPKVMFIEEAAETLEAPITIACVESLQHLVLVGDHKQLRPHCGIRQFEGPPYNLNISLFERLVDNNVEFSMLNQQRRMNPEIARLLRPIYGDNIQNHNDVLGGRPASRLFQDMNVWFFTHENPDERDSMSSSFNSEEAKMIFGLIKFMSYNGVDSEHMTVLTFYNGQRRRFNSLLKKAGEFWTDRLSNIKVVTIDSYQGEENEFVFLSLVRNNEEGSIGFTGNENRVCVALSRARRGLFVFGNGEMMCGASEIWANVVREVHNNKKSRDPVGRRIGYYLHLQCKTHMRKFYIQDAAEWDGNVGGCDWPCNYRMKCGHKCPELCHPWDHDRYRCMQRCERKVQACGHVCSRRCCDSCKCKICSVDRVREGNQSSSGTSRSHSSNPTARDERDMLFDGPGLKMVHSRNSSGSDPPPAENSGKTNSASDIKDAAIENRHFANGEGQRQDRAARNNGSRSASLQRLDEENERFLFGEDPLSSEQSSERAQSTFLRHPSRPPPPNRRGNEDHYVRTPTLPNDREQRTWESDGGRGGTYIGIHDDVKASRHRSSRQPEPSLLD